MTEVLSEQEMSALLSETRAGSAAVASSGPATGRRFVPFSFGAPVPFSADALERLSGLGARFAETLQGRLARDLRREIGAAPGQAEVLGGAEAGQLFTGGVHLRFAGPGARHEADLVLDTEIALSLVEARLGGSVAEPQPRRALTPVELSILVRLFGAGGGAALAASFGASAIQDHGHAPPAGGRGEAAGGPGGASGTGAGGADAGRYQCVTGGGEGAHGSSFVSIPLQLTIESRAGAATLLVPATRAAETIAMTAAPAAAGPPSGVRISPKAIRKLPVRIVPRIPGGSISLRDLSALRSGLVVRLDHRESAPIEVLCNGEPVLSGRLIRSGPATALEIASWAVPETTRKEGP